MRTDDALAVDLGVEIVSRLTPANWRSDSDDARVEGDPEVEQVEQRVALDDQVLADGNEFLRPALASERSSCSQVTG